MALLGFIILLLNIATGTGVSFSYRAPSTPPKGIYLPQKKRNPSHIPRVVIDKSSSDEHIVSGHPTSTFRQLLRTEWPFTGVSKNAQWAIVDERGNDITDSTLESFHGIAELRVLGRTEATEYHTGEPNESQDDESDRYTSIDQGVTYYD
ncbi:MAG: hypothetical protein P1Q69_06800 [Candidatus Thorarchaeota archaeon]|nr:hypothetical protein [Candidatus Thorarchaeota archaeon]